MKKKWLFNVITLALCICAMAIGVYAAKQASLTVNGTIAFNAHNCKVQVSGTVNAYNEEGSAKLTGDSATLPTTIVDGKAETVTFPTAIYFSDMEEGGDTISLNLTITNLSAFAIDGKVNSPVFKLGTTVSTMVTSTVSTTTFTLEPNANTPVTITFTLTNIQSANSITNGNYQLSMEFEKSVPKNEIILSAQNSNLVANLQVDNILVENEKGSQTVSATVQGGSTQTESVVKFTAILPYKESDTIEDISLTLSLQNTGSTKSLVEITGTGLPTNVTLSTAQQYITLPFKTYIAPNSTKSITFGISTSGTVQQKINEFDLNISSTQDTGNHSTLFQYEENFDTNGDGNFTDGYWYATMGTNPYSGYNEPLKWLPIASYAGTATSATTSASYGKFDYTTNCPTVGSSYYLLSQYILDVLPTTYLLSYNYYVNSSPYNARYYDGTTSWPILTNVQGNDYSVSNIRSYLNNTRTAFRTYDSSTISGSYIGKAGTELTTMQTQFNLSNGDVYKSIVPRTQTSLYKEMKYATTYPTENNPDYSTAWDADNTLTANTVEDNFWLLSGYEIYNFIDSSVAMNSSSNTRKAYKLSSAGGTLSAGYWWSRSPDASLAYRAYGVYSSGNFYGNGVYYAYAGARPALQISCTA